LSTKGSVGKIYQYIIFLNSLEGEWGGSTAY